jgi:hypothetical protein
MNTKGPMLATAWRQRRVRSSPVSVLGAGVIHAPPLVSSITVLVASSTCGVKLGCEVKGLQRRAGGRARGVAQFQRGTPRPALPRPTMRPPPTAPPEMCSRAPTNTAPCW